MNQLLKEKEVKIIPSYRCSNCQKEFKILIDINYPFLCGSNCRFIWNHRIIKNLNISDSNLEKLQCLLEGVQKINNFTRSKAMYSIAKHLNKIGVKHNENYLDLNQKINKSVEGQGTRQEKEGQKPGTK